MLWLWMFMRILDGKCCPAPDGARKGSRGGRWQSPQDWANGRGVQHAHDDDVKQGKEGEFRKRAAPSAVRGYLTSVEPGDSLVAL